MATTTVRHDGFARESLERESHINYHGTESCTWCGRRPHVLYSYEVKSDADMRPSVRRGNPKKFCNLECFDDYK